MFTKKTRLRQFLLSFLRRFRPTETYLHTLSRKDRSGLHIDLPVVEISSLEKGRLAFSKGELAESLHLFALAIKCDPNNAWGWHGRGDALQCLGDYNGALQAYEHAISLQPHTALHFGGKANALQGLQRHQESKIVKQHALELDGSIKWIFQN